jgi:hypothetical protein
MTREIELANYIFDKLEMACYKLLCEIDQVAQNLEGDTKFTPLLFRTRIAGASATIAQIVALFALGRCLLSIR